MTICNHGVSQSNKELDSWLLCWWHPREHPLCALVRVIQRWGSSGRAKDVTQGMEVRAGSLRVLSAGDHQWAAQSPGFWAWALKVAQSRALGTSGTPHHSRAWLTRWGTSSSRPPEVWIPSAQRPMPAASTSILLCLPRLYSLPPFLWSKSSREWPNNYFKLFQIISKAK